MRRPDRNPLRRVARTGDLRDAAFCVGVPPGTFRPVRFARRLAALVAYGTAVAMLYLIAAPVLPNRAQPEEVAVAAPSRPAGVPARVPAWAWELFEWETTEPALRPRRPESVPRTLPAWYGEWRAWRSSVSRG